MRGQDRLRASVWEATCGDKKVQNACRKHPKGSALGILPGKAEFRSGNGAQERSKSQPQEVHVAPKMKAGGCRRGQAERKKLLKAPGTPQDAARPSSKRPFGSPAPFLTRQGSIAKKELEWKAVWEGFLGFSETDLEGVFKASA